MDKQLTKKFSLPITHIDLAAVLYALGFEMKNFQVINHLDMENNRRSKSAIFEFADESPQGLKLEDVIKSYHLPEKGSRCKNIMQRAKLAAHNYQVLKSVIKENQPLKQVICDGYTLLKNANAEEIPLAPGVDYTENLEAVAIACAFGCIIDSYRNASVGLQVACRNAPNGFCLQDVINAIASVSGASEDDFSALTVLCTAFENRKDLLSETYSNNKLHITNGYKQAIIPKNASDELKDKVLKFIN